MIIKQLVDEDFVNYKKPSMFIGFPKCSWKCEKECGQKVCQNSALSQAQNIEIDAKTLMDRYLSNPITSAIVCGGLEPFDSWDDLQDLVTAFRCKCNDEFVIYTGYNKDEIQNQIEWLKQFSNIIIKYGRYIPNNEPHYDKVLGVYLASPNQVAEKICSIKYGYIYKTTNLINNKIYIGQHKSTEFDANYMGSGIAIKAAFKKYGRENFKVEVIDTSANNADELNNLETYYIQKYNSRDPKIGYNLHCGGNVQSGINNPMYGRHFKKTPEAIEKTRQAKLGKPLTQEQRQKISNTRKQRIESGDIVVWNKGVNTGPRSLETRIKNSQTLKERWENDEEFVNKMRQIYQSRIGKKRSDEFCEKQRQNAKGNTNVRGYKWYTDGENNVRCPEGQQPENYYPGRVGIHHNQYTKAKEN